VLWYLLAHRLFEEAPKSPGTAPGTLHEEALRSAERGNQAPQYRLVAFDLPVPPFSGRLGLPNQPRQLGNLDFNLVLGLAKHLDGYITQAEARQDDKEVLRGARCLMNMGMNAFRHYAPEDNGDMTASPGRHGRSD
jgi:hypothetical protein